MRAAADSRATAERSNHPARQLSALLYSGLFAATGFGTAVFGAALPALLVRWSLGDAGGGLLFFAAWFGAALGAVASRGPLHWSVLRGTALAGAAAWALAYARGAAIFPLSLLYGLGLGIAMTSISLLRAREMGPRRGRELNRLNLLWSVGALTAPSLAAHALRTGRPGYLFQMLAFGLLLFAGLVLLDARRARTAIQATAPAASGMHAPLLLCAASALIVGIEASLAAWLAAFSERAEAGSVRAAVGVGTAFWAGLLLSRALHSTPLLRGERLWPYAAVLAAALSPMLWAADPRLLAALACVQGAAIGPLYPLLLAVATARYRGSRVFLAAGLGAALFPWLTGLVSDASGSLRAGLGVPCAAGLLLLALTAHPLRARA